jgi:hypothetical protein
MKTIKQIWDETPNGQAIKDEDYLNFLVYINKKCIPYTIKDLANQISGLWDMNCQQATKAFDKWLQGELYRNPDFIIEINENKYKTYFGD